jgi:hypothetical protein
VGLLVLIYTGRIGGAGGRMVVLIYTGTIGGTPGPDLHRDNRWGRRKNGGPDLHNSSFFFRASD